MWKQMSYWLRLRFVTVEKMKSDLKGPEEDCRAFVMLAVRERTNTDVTS